VRRFGLIFADDVVDDDDANNDDAPYRPPSRRRLICAVLCSNAARASAADIVVVGVDDGVVADIISLSIDDDDGDGDDATVIVTVLVTNALLFVTDVGNDTSRWSCFLSSLLSSWLPLVVTVVAAMVCLFGNGSLWIARLIATWSTLRFFVNVLRRFLITGALIPTLMTAASLAVTAIAAAAAAATAACWSNDAATATISAIIGSSLWRSSLVGSCDDTDDDDNGARRRNRRDLIPLIDDNDDKNVLEINVASITIASGVKQVWSTVLHIKHMHESHMMNVTLWHHNKDNQH
jgi:hypothetical protein